MGKNKKKKGVPRMKNPPPPPSPPLDRVLRDGIGYLCTNCGSTMGKSGFLGLFGERYCDNDECKNSKPKKNYYKR